ncbi:thioesterase family protein [Dinoroseobacter sp. S76]|uniref:thioesterase family protein n=1 Tax=Dinoroseobacter sp. S76 TaxID=3415124 RepID=UPI003C7A1818
MTGIVAIIGSGVIGAGWAARFLLGGWHVRVFDPDPGAETRLEATIARAKVSLPGLYDTPLPPPGRLSLHATIPEAVSGATWIQENLPERLELKRKVFQTIQAACAPEAILASSSAGLTLDALRACATRPAQICAIRPCDPVYLLPLAEVTCPEPAVADRIQAILTGLGMIPSDGSVTQSLQAALLRRALEMIRDGEASPVQIDEALRLGLAPLWSQRGPFGTASDGAGPAQFALTEGADGKAWTDSPADTPALSRSSPPASDARFVQRDAALVGMLRALKAETVGAGAGLADADRARVPAQGADTAPLLTAARTVPRDWADYNGHMTEARYLHAFGNATDRFMEILGVDADYLASGGSFFTAETHIRHLAELRIGAAFEIRTTCLDGTGKRMHLWHEMRCDGVLVATGEHMLIHVSLETRRPAPPASPVAEALARIAQAHARLATGPGVGRAIGDPR